MGQTAASSASHSISQPPPRASLFYRTTTTKSSPPRTPPRIPPQNKLYTMFEVAVLKPYDEDKDQESWPLLELTNATVYKYRHRMEGTMADLLDVQDTGPYRIKGKLSKIPADLEDIIVPGRESRIYEEEMTLTQVTTYSIEQFEDGTIKIWALGRCGWYSIKPSIEYKPYFKTMMRKVKLWCFLQDLYCEKYQGQGKPIAGSVDDLYADYARQGFGCSSARAAAKLFDKHRRYLLFEMCGIRADAEMWARTPLFRAWMKDYKNEIEGVKKSMACAKAPEVKEDSPPAVVEKEESPASSLSNVSAKKTRIHNRSIIYQVWKVIYQYIMDKDLRPTEVTKGRIIAITRKKFVFSSLDHAAEALEARAPEILVLMEYPPPAMIYPPGWTSTPAYKQFGDVKEQKADTAEHQRRFILRSDYDDSDTEETIGVRPPVIVRTPAQPPSEARNKNPVTPVGGSDEDSDSSEDENPRGRKHRSAKGKSVLRPVRAPAPPPRGLSPSESVDGEPVLDDTPTAFPLARKRDLDDTDGTPAAKRPRTRGPNVQPSAATPSGLSAFSTTTMMTTTTTTIISTKPPALTKRPKTTGANKPGGHWECEIAGCKHSILDANDPANLRLIEQHYEEHGRVMKQAMEAIGGEILPSRPRHHVDNLLAKIEAMAKKWAMSKPAPLTSLELGLPPQNGSGASSGL